MVNRLWTQRRTMLTPDNIATLRRAAYRSQSRRADEAWSVARFAGGPLDGIRLSVLQREAVSPSLGFFTITDTGPVRNEGETKAGQVDYSRMISRIAPRSRVRLAFRDLKAAVVLTDAGGSHYRYRST